MSEYRSSGRVEQGGASALSSDHTSLLQVANASASSGRNPGETGSAQAQKKAKPRAGCSGLDAPPWGLLGLSMAIQALVPLVCLALHKHTVGNQPRKWATQDSFVPEGEARQERIYLDIISFISPVTVQEMGRLSSHQV